MQKILKNDETLRIRVPKKLKQRLSTIANARKPAPGFKALTASDVARELLNKAADDMDPNGKAKAA